jgi:hypothetical protein
LAASCAGAIYAQSFTGSINGAVTDQAGAAFANASITLTAGATGQLRSTTTNTVSHALRADAQLSVGSAKETVNISASEGGVAVETQNVPLDVIQEFRVQTNNYTAATRSARRGCRRGI